jgi:hypothetical protein
VVPVNEGCGSFTCSQTNPGNTGPAIINVPCGTSGSFNPYAEYEAEVAAAQAAAKKSSWLWTLLIIGIALVLIFLIILFIHPNLYPSEGAIVPIQKPFNPQFERSSQFSSIEGSTIGEGGFTRSNEYPSAEIRGTSGNFIPSREYSSIEGNKISNTFSRQSTEYSTIET